MSEYVEELERQRRLREALEERVRESERAVMRWERFMNRLAKASYDVGVLHGTILLLRASLKDLRDQIESGRFDLEEELGMTLSDYVWLRDYEDD